MKRRFLFCSCEYAVFGLVSLCRAFFTELHKYEVRHFIAISIHRLSEGCIFSQLSSALFSKFISKLTASASVIDIGGYI